MGTRHRGVLRGIHDARDIAKAICTTPRHPELPRQARLRQLPHSLYVDQMLRKAAHSRNYSGLRSRRDDGEMQTGQAVKWEGTSYSVGYIHEAKWHKGAKGELNASRAALDAVLAAT